MFQCVSDGLSENLAEPQRLAVANVFARMSVSQDRDQRWVEWGQELLFSNDDSCSKPTPEVFDPSPTTALESSSSAEN
jgi:hypothetical protein